jgi:hypothetical protein
MTVTFSNIPSERVIQQGQYALRVKGASMGDMLQDRVAVITGAGNGLGRAHAIGMAAQGASYSQLKRE